MSIFPKFWKICKMLLNFDFCSVMLKKVKKNEIIFFQNSWLNFLIFFFKNFWSLLWCFWNFLKKWIKVNFFCAPDQPKIRFFYFFVSNIRHKWKGKIYDFLWFFVFFFWCFFVIFCTFFFKKKKSHFWQICQNSSTNLSKSLY